MEGRTGEAIVLKGKDMATLLDFWNFICENDIADGSAVFLVDESNIPYAVGNCAVSEMDCAICLDATMSSLGNECDLSVSGIRKFIEGSCFAVEENFMLFGKIDATGHQREIAGFVSGDDAPGDGIYVFFS